MTREEALDILMSANVWNDEERTALGTLLPEFRMIEDERIRKELKEAFEAYDIESKWNGIPIRSIFAWLEKQKEQNWNKKPCLTCQEYEKGHKQGYTEGCTAGYNKAMKEVEQKEQKLEWSEEDKEKIVTISEIIEHCTTIPYSGGTLTLNKEYKKELLCFIKSLRTQPKRNCKDCAMFLNGECTKPHWKPSEEQMAALEAATVRYQSTGLESLYEDLKKL